MLKPTTYGLKEYEKAVIICAIRAGYKKCECVAKGGSRYAFRLYQLEGDQIPCEIWTIDVEHSKKKRIYPRDFRKSWEHLGIKEGEFRAVIENI